SVEPSSEAVPLGCMTMVWVLIALQAIGMVRFQVTGRAPMCSSSCTPLRLRPASSTSHRAAETERTQPQARLTRSHRRYLFQKAGMKACSGIALLCRVLSRSVQFAEQLGLPLLSGPIQRGFCCRPQGHIALHWLGSGSYCEQSLTVEQ